jgi:alpha-glucosidase
MDIITSIEKPQDNKQYPDSIIDFKKINENIFDFNSPILTLRVYVISEKVFRIRYAIKGFFEKDFSYSIDPNYTFTQTNIQFIEKDELFILKTQEINLEIEKKGFLLTFKNNFGKILNKDARGFHWEENLLQGGQMVYCSKKKMQDECFYGMGDKPTDLNLHERRVSNWNSDTYGFEKDHDPIYRSIPLYIGMHDSNAYGIFFDNTFRSTFDFAHENWETISFWADGGEMNYYFIYGPDLDEVTQLYTSLTGKPEMPPKWALGFHQCKWSYYPEAQVKEIAQEFRSRKIPCDSIYLDIDYMDGFRCFTWNKEHFPDPKRMIKELKDDGFKTVVIIDPGIKIDKDYWVWNEGWEKDMFCKRSDGPLMTGDVWPGACNFPDFTDPKVREWWAGLFEDYYSLGIAGVWNDMNEPAVFGLGTFPDDVRHNYDGHLSSHKKAHNIYGMQMARASKMGFEKFKPESRPFQITRSAFAGFQRYACVWTGDNISTWEHLAIASKQMQRLSISGVSFCGSDIGGFIGEPNGELFTRWIQLAFMHTFFRAHSSGDNGEKEPWVFGEKYESIIKKFIEIRYKLLPYIYTNFYFYHTKGSPMLKPLVFEDQFDPETPYRQDEFLIGDHLLACPILKPGAVGRWLYLPSGNWYNYFNNTILNGGSEQYCDTGLEETPLFVRAGAILPHYPLQQYVDELVIDSVLLKVYYSTEKILSYYYEDKGDGHEYKTGEYLLNKFETSFDSKTTSYKIVQSKSGSFTSSVKSYQIELIGFPKSFSTVKVDDNEMHLQNTKTIIDVSADFKTITIG